jgi:MFS family permease
MSGLNLAINTYFRERRSKAVGFGMTAMGLGPVFMPLVISKLMDIYGVTGTALILGGLSLHSLVAALLLQPVKWHMKPMEVSLETMENADEADGEPDDEKGEDPALGYHFLHCLKLVCKTMPDKTRLSVGFQTTITHTHTFTHKKSPKSPRSI